MVFLAAFVVLAFVRYNTVWLFLLVNILPLVLFLPLIRLHKNTMLFVSHKVSKQQYKDSRIWSIIASALLCLLFLPQIKVSLLPISLLSIIDGVHFEKLFILGALFGLLLMMPFWIFLVKTKPLLQQIEKGEEQFSQKSGLSSWFSAKGRIGRMEYFVKNIIILPVLTIIVVVALFAPIYFGISVYAIIASYAVIAFIVLINVYISACFIIKRFHDIDMSGWSYLLLFIPLVNIYFILALFFQASQPYGNKYGKARNKVVQNSQQAKTNIDNSEEDIIIL